MSELTQECVRSLFDYRDGELYWKVSRGNGMKIGDLAGTVRTDGYRSIQINGKLYLAHRLIFLYHYGYIPKEIDHIDSNPSNNNISNLRESRCTGAKSHESEKEQILQWQTDIIEI